MAVADMISPVPYHQTFEQYKQFKQLNQGKQDPGTDANDQKATLSEEELKSQYDAMIAMEREVSQTKNNFIQSLGWVVIPLPVFIFFHAGWLTKKTNKSGIQYI